MEHKRDASMAGLPWPRSTTRDAPSPDATSSGAASSEMHTTMAPSSNPTTLTPTTITPPSNPTTLTPTTMAPSTTSTPSTSGPSPPIPPPNTTSTSLTSYTNPSTPAPPFPHTEHLHYDLSTHPRHFERIVHQIQFKIYTRANNDRSLYIEEIPASGISRCRDPEHFFYGLSSNWDWACHTADYWRHFFDIPLVHGFHPYAPIDIVPPRTSESHPPTTDLAQLARQLEDAWTAALASGELQQGSHLLNNMIFSDALRAIGQRDQPTESTSSWYWDKWVGFLVVSKSYNYGTIQALHVFQKSTLLRQGVCVKHLNRCKTSFFAFESWLRYCTLDTIIRFSIKIAGGQRMASRRWPTKLVMSWEAVGDVQLCTCEFFHCDGTGLSQVPQYQEFISSWL